MSKYDNFTFFSDHPYLDAPELDAAVEAFIGPIREHAKITRWPQRFTDHLRLILLNLCHTYNQDPNRYIAYSRDKNKYTEFNKKSRRYRCAELRYESMVMLIDSLMHQKFGYAEGREKGFYVNDGSADGASGEMARMRATPKLIDLLTNTHKIPTHKITSHPDLDPIVMREKRQVRIERGAKKGELEWRKFDVEYEDTPETYRMRDNLKRINKLINEHFIGLAAPDKVLEHMKREMVSKAQRKRGKARNIDFTKTTNRRKFNNGKWDQGGRFYNGWWQEVPSAYRKYIRIDNLSTVEIDYSGLHFMLLYLEAGLGLPAGEVYELDYINEKIRKYVDSLTIEDLQEVTNEYLEEDPPDVSGMPTEEYCRYEEEYLSRKTAGEEAPWNPPDMFEEVPEKYLRNAAERFYKKAARKFLKKASNIALNAEGEEAAIGAINYECRDERAEAPFLKGIKTKDLIQLLSDKHSALGTIFYTGQGVFLQNTDSHLAERIMLNLADKGIPALPVHDSFIVSRLHKDDLLEAMQVATQEKYGVPINVKNSETAWGSIYGIGIEEEVGSVENMESPDWTDINKYTDYHKRMQEFELRTGKDVMAIWEQTCKDNESM